MKTFIEIWLIRQDDVVDWPNKDAFVNDSIVTFPKRFVDDISAFYNYSCSLASCVFKSDTRHQGLFDTCPRLLESSFVLVMTEQPFELPEIAEDWEIFFVSWCWAIKNINICIWSISMWHINLKIIFQHLMPVMLAAKFFLFFSSSFSILFPNPAAYHAIWLSTVLKDFQFLLWLHDFAGLVDRSSSASTSSSQLHVVDPGVGQ